MKCICKSEMLCGALQGHNGCCGSKSSIVSSQNRRETCSDEQNGVDRCSRNTFVLRLHRATPLKGAHLSCCVEVVGRKEVDVSSLGYRVADGFSLGQVFRAKIGDTVIPVLAYVS